MCRGPKPVSRTQRTGLCIFVALLSASWVMPLFMPPASASRAGDLSMEVPRQVADGRGGGRAGRTLDHAARYAGPPSPLPFGWDLKRGMNLWAQMGVIIAASYVLEDPTTVFTGLMISQGQIDPFVGLIAVFVGIFTGDLGLYLIGYVAGRRLLRWRIVSSRLPTRHADGVVAWFDRRGWSAVLASRFIPGTRLPLYVAAGALGHRPGRFALWTCFAVMIWAVAMLLATVLLGEIVLRLTRSIAGRWLALPLALLLMLLLIRVLTLTFTSIGRARLKSAVTRVWRWEFWPVWFFYLPVLPWIAWLSLRRRGFATITAVNPGMPDSGFVDESKIDILRKLPDAWIVPSAAVSSAEQLCSLMHERGWTFPLILKPDSGERGYGVRKVTSRDGVDAYFAESGRAVLAQVYDPGPFEAGVFYYRIPGENAGHIFSITDKVFPVLEGDGRHTVEELIYRHPRFCMQAGTFLGRLGDDRDRVLSRGETLPLATAGNHCQGTMFRDGAHLITPGLERAIDRIARAYDGFYFGRFDVRYRDADAFRTGAGFKIVELNGVTSESTDIYDPGLSLAHAYRTLWRQWSLAFQIGSINRRNGAKVTPSRHLLGALVRHHRNKRRSLSLAD